MKRGFLNSKRANGVQPQPLDDKPAPKVERLAVSSKAPPTQLAEGTTALGVVSLPVKRSEPVAGSKLLTTTIPASLLITDPYAIVRVPSLKLIGSNEPFSTCIFRDSTCSKINDTPGFYTPIPPPNPTTVVFTKKTATMGIGLFANSTFKVNQVIFSERPLLIFPRGLPMHGLQGLSAEDAVKKGWSVFEVNFRNALSVMTKEAADAFLSLSNRLVECPRLYGIAFTNAFGTDIDEENVEEGKFEYAAVGKLASRINHSCMPNVRVDFHIPTFSLRVIARRDIKAGEQFFYCYCEPDRSVQERQRQLATYGFECRCKACVNATPETDRLREELDNILQKVFDQEKEMFANPWFNVHSLSPLLKLEKDIVKEGLDLGEKFVRLLIIVFEAYGKLNDFVKEMEYFNKVKKYRGQTD